MPPTVSRQPESGVVTADIGDTVRLVCRGDAFPDPSVTWFHDGQLHGRSSVKSGGECCGGGCEWCCLRSLERRLRNVEDE